MNSIGIYIDGILAISAEDCGENLCFWLVDIDKGDGYIELLTYHDMAYDLWYYDKKGNIKSAGKVYVVGTMFMLSTMKQQIYVSLLE